MINEKIEQLPEDIKNYIKELTCERDEAIQALDRYLNNQTESPFSYSETLASDTKRPSVVTKFIQTREVSVSHSDIFMNISLHSTYIEIRFNGRENSYSEVAIIPSAYQKIRLVSKLNMRS